MRPSLLGFLSLLLVSAPGPLIAAPGDIDAAFGTNGIITIDVNNQQSFPGGFAIQDDGKLVLAGAVGPVGARDFLLVRGTPDGASDPDFAAGSLVVTSISAGEDLGRDVAVLPDGKILVAGVTDLNGSFDVAFIRYNADGSLDTNFGSGGIAVAPIPSLFVFPMKMALQADGRMLVVGGSGSPPSIFVARYQGNGTLDSSFDSDGYTEIQPGGHPGIGNSVVVQGDGKIVVAGNSGPSGDQDLTVLRLDPDGGLDTDFDGDGVAIASFGSDASYATALALQPDGAIVATGGLELSGGSEVLVARFLPDGSLDASFGTGGTISTPAGSGGGNGTAVALQGDGKILVGGVVSKGLLDSDTILLRHLAGGGLDPDFAGAGLVTVDAGSSDRASAVGLASDGKILVAGNTVDDLVLIRFENDAPPPPPAGSSGGCHLIADR